MSEHGGAPTRLYLLRHGLVDNPDELAYGHLPRFRLSPEGREQADAAGRWLADKGIAAIFTSPLLRARQTVRIIRRYLDDAPLHTLRALRESELARVWQGARWQEIAHKYPELYETFLEAPSRITAGETMAAMAARMRSACLRAARRYPGASLTLVSHRDPILALRLGLEGRPDELNSTKCAQCSITEFATDGRALEFVAYVEP
jgi:probable phosphoglycerate mutase